jgi:hypothetical protein
MHRTIIRVCSRILPGALALAAALQAAPARVGTGEARGIPPAFLGFNINLIRGGTWDEPGYAGAIARLEPGHIRYPAGTIANYWDWREGGFIAREKIPPSLRGAKFPPYRVAELRKACDLTGARPVFVLNLLTSTLEEQLAFLRAAHGAGLPVERVELGNEYYLEHSRDYVERFADGGAYGREASEWAAAIKKEFPGVRVAAVGAAVRDTDPPRRKHWNAQIWRTLKNVDAVTYHVYNGSGLNHHEQARSLEGEELKSPQEKARVQTSLEAQKSQAARFAESAGPDTMLAQAWGRLDSFAEPAQTPENIEIWITEYGLFDRTGPLWSTWAHGLFTGLMTLRFLEEPRVSLLTYHSIGGRAQFTAVFRDADGFKGVLVPPGLRSVPNGHSAAGHVLQLINRAARPATSAAMLDIAGVPQKNAGAGAMPSVYGWAFFTPQKQARLILMNLSAKEKSLDLSALAKDGAPVLTLAAPIRERLLGGETLGKTIPLRAAGLALPAYSITLVGAD